MMMLMPNKKHATSDKTSGTVGFCGSGVILPSGVFSDIVTHSPVPTSIHDNILDCEHTAVEQDQVCVHSR